MGLQHPFSFFLSSPEMSPWPPPQCLGRTQLDQGDTEEQRERAETPSHCTPPPSRIKGGN